MLGEGTFTCGKGETRLVLFQGFVPYERDTCMDELRTEKAHFLRNQLGAINVFHPTNPFNVLISLTKKKKKGTEWRVLPVC